MKIAIHILFCLLVGFAFGQEVSSKKLNKKDSILYSQYKNKMAQTINAYPDSALQYIKKINKFSAERNFAVGSADSDYLFAQYYRRMQLPDSAIFYFKKSVATASKINYQRGLAVAYNGLCRTYYLIGEIENSIKACNKSLQYIQDFEDTGNLIFADTHNALAIAYSRQNKMEEAIKRLLIVDSIHKKEALREDIIAAAYQSLGNVYLQLKDYKSAEQYYLKANKEFEKIPGAGTFYFNTTNVYLGQVYYHTGKLEKANELLSKTFDFFTTINDERTAAEVSNYLGLVHFEQGKFDSAETFFKNSFQFQKENEYTLEAAQTALQLGKLNIEKKKANEAVIYLKASLLLNKNTKNGIVNYEAHSLLANAYAQLGNYSEAYDNAEIAAKINDSIQQFQSAEKIKEIEGRYQTESRDREIALLTSKNELAEQQKINQRNILSAVVALITLAALFLFFQIRNRQKTNYKLKELDKAKSTFFANISHEFRTPLTLIYGPIEDQLASKNISNSDRKNLHVALRNTQRMRELVDQLLALSKLESKNLKLKVQFGNLPQFLMAEADAFAHSVAEKYIDFTVKVDKDEIVDWFDTDAIEKILYNLIGNALKYTPEDGKICILGKRTDTEFEIEVQNTGNFISAEHQLRIFERFYQTYSKSPGAGIGLALTKELVELHHGSITVTSEKDGLTIFKLKIPTNKNAYESEEIFVDALLELSQEIIFETIPAKGKQLLVPEDAPILLIVDDSQEIREYVASIFETTHTIHSAKDGIEGFQKSLDNIPDIVISDVMMPEDDGFSLTKKIKEHQLTSHIPVILLTAKTQVTAKLEAMGIGADAYVTKPFNPQLLKATVENLIETRRKLQKRFSQEIFLTPKEIAISSADEQFLERLQTVMDQNLTEASFTVENFGKEMGVSRMQLHRKLKALTGQSTSEFLRSQRLKLSVKLLRENKIGISEIGYLVGFNDPSYFTRCFKQEYGCAPSDYITC